MRKYLLAAVAAAAIATPAVARDGAGYVGLEGGIMFPEDWDLEGEFIFTDPELTDFPEGDIADLEFKRGVDLDLIGGYDFGMVRGELAQRGHDRTAALDGFGDRELVAFPTAEKREAFRQDNQLGAVGGGLHGKCAAGREVSGEIVGRTHLHRSDPKLSPLAHAALVPR
jgi:hypothetical protein